ncbi:MAG: hypothetical protein COW78_19620 [Bdellovibrio sp. CG22_combo_CG10-13_8_21_14_all_39_27]|nr:MAG: hypothetical protein COW78_19620 [Bdellovibrio sp. CG22_combo_CG10-13_8_21_14_all_39_27]
MIAPINVSKERRANFKAACDLEGFKKISIVLEDLIGQLNETYFKASGKLKIEVEGFNDRAVSSISCEVTTWQTFKEVCNKNHLKIADVIEAVMGDYVTQIEKTRKIKIINGKVKK